MEGRNERKYFPGSVNAFSPGDGELGLPFLLSHQFLGRKEQSGLSFSEAGSNRVPAIAQTEPFTLAATQKGGYYSLVSKRSLIC